MPIKIEVWGDYACFTRPEMKVERCSYDVMTPSAARGIVEAIYWHPGIRWVIDKIHVLNEIKFTNIRRNEVKSKISASKVRGVMSGGVEHLYITTSDDIAQRAALVLQDVRYVIEAHFELVPEKMAPGDNEGKFCDIVKRRVAKGQCYHQPCFGTREFPANFRTWDGGGEGAYQGTERDLGFMLYDMDYSNPEDITPMFFRAVMKNGVINLRDCEVYK